MDIGDRIGIDGSQGYNHGCQDYAVAEITAVNGDHHVVTTVIEAQSCHSCWQVSHDADHVFAEIGDVLTFPITELDPANDTWSRNIKWQR